MDNFIKSFDNLPQIVKIIFAIPFLDIIWAVYRIIKGISTNNILMLVLGILWIIPGSFICWILDLIFTILGKQPLFA